MPSEDITFCANRKCRDTKCERNSRRIRLPILHSFALFRDCPKWDENGAKWLTEQMSQDEKMSKALSFMHAQHEAEKAGSNEFACPICGGIAWWKRSPHNNHLHAGCKGCGMKMME